MRNLPKQIFTFYLLVFLFLSVVVSSGLAQGVAINNDGSLANNKSILDVKSTTMGTLVPRMDSLQKVTFGNTLGVGEAGMLIFDTNVQHFFFWDGVAFVKMNAGSIKLVDADGDTQVQVEESADEDKIRFDLEGIEKWVMTSSTLEPKNTGGSVFIGEGAGANDDLSDNANVAIGNAALYSNTDKSNIVAIGDSTLYNNGIDATESWHAGGNTALGSKALLSNSYGWSNTAMGNRALHSNTTGNNNSALGREALANNTEGKLNTAFGRSALLSNIDGDENTAAGVDAMKSNTSGFKNTVMGRSALHQNTIGSNNVAIGKSALWSNQTGSNNIAIGAEALANNTDRSGLVAIGDSALFNNGLNSPDPIHARSNTAVGNRSLRSNESGRENTAIGFRSLYHNVDGLWNTAIGYDALFFNVDGGSNTAIGRSALGSNNDQDNNTAIGSLALATLEGGESNTAIGSGAAAGSQSGSNNVAIGRGALAFNTTGSKNTMVGTLAGESGFGLASSGNVFIGYAAGRFENDSDRLYIENSSSTSPLIYGEFDNNFLQINGSQELTGELNINKTNVILKAFGKEALWTDGNYFSWGFGGTYNYFSDKIKLGGGGTSTPISDFHIEDAGDASITLESTGVGTDAFIQFTDDATSGSADWTIRRDESDGGKLQFRHNNFHKLTMTTNGNLGIGPNASSPAYTLFVDGSAGKPGGGSWTNSSDRRLKQNINDYHHGLNEVMRIRPVTFHYNELSGYDTDPEYVGVIAQELKEVAPYMVAENETGYLDVNNSAMTYMLINAVQDQQKMIEMQSKQIEALAEELAVMKEKNDSELLSQLKKEP